MEKLVVKAERVKKDGDRGVFAFVRDTEDWSLQRVFLEADQNSHPWEYEWEFLKNEKNIFDSTIRVVAGKQGVPLELEIEVPISYWELCGKLITVFFFVETGKDRIVSPTGIAFRLPPDLISDGERRIRQLGLDFFYDMVLQVGNPYSPQYAELVWTSFVKNRYRQES